MVQIIVLAAGKGTRMRGNHPKVLTPMNGRPIIKYLLDNITTVCAEPIIVVGYKGEDVIQALGSRWRYVWQKEQLGTAHAVMCAETALKETAVDSVIVLYGDHPLVTSQTLDH